MKLRSVRLAIIVSAFILSGLPMLLMQLGAWGLMIGQREDDEAVLDIVRVAFLGTEPCHRCRVIGDWVGKDNTEEMNFLKLSEVRLMSMQLLKEAFLVRIADRPMMILSMESFHRYDRLDSPPTPPPRQLFAS